MCIAYWHTLEISVCDFRVRNTALSSVGGGGGVGGPRILYAFPSDAPEEDLVRRKSFLPDDAKSPDLINGGLGDLIAFYYHKLKSDDERSIWAILEFICISEE